MCVCVCGRRATGRADVGPLNRIPAPRRRLPFVAPAAHPLACLKPDGRRELMGAPPFDVWHAFISGCCPLPEIHLCEGAVTCRDTCRAGRGERRASARSHVICGRAPPGPGPARGTRALERSSNTRQELKRGKSSF